MKIVQAPYITLAQQAKPVTKINSDIHHVIETMIETLNQAHDPEGVGLAAPQIGKSLQIFIIKPTKKAAIDIYINPVVTPLSTPQKKSVKKSNTTQLEGCLSLQGVWGEVKRIPQVEVTYLDEAGKTRIKKCSGFYATILQHEYDHLNGILFPKRVLEQRGQLYRSNVDKDGKEIFEEISL